MPRVARIHRQSYSMTDRVPVRNMKDELNHLYQKDEVRAPGEVKVYYMDPKELDKMYPTVKSSKKPFIPCVAERKRKNKKVIG